QRVARVDQFDSGTSGRKVGIECEWYDPTCQHSLQECPAFWVSSAVAIAILAKVGTEIGIPLHMPTQIFRVVEQLCLRKPPFEPRFDERHEFFWTDVATRRDPVGHRVLE